MFLTLLKHAVLDQPTVDSGDLPEEGLWLWLLAVGYLHFDGTSTALQQPFKGKTKFVSVLLSTLVMRVSVSRMQDFFGQ